MRTRIVFIIFVAAVALAAMPSPRPAKIQDRMETGDVQGFCRVYYDWRDEQPGNSGIQSVDGLCFAVQTMQP